MNDNIFSECLSNCNSSLELCTIQLRYFRVKDVPSLLTIYEIIHPIDIAVNSLTKVIKELNEENVKTESTKGLFVLGVSNFEIMLSDLLKKMLSFFPNKLSLFKSENETRKEKGELKISSDLFINGEFLNSLITREVDRISYGNINKLIKTFFNILSIKNTIKENDVATLIEIKERRNLLLHNNLYVNSQYLNKTIRYKRPVKFGKQLTVDKLYSINSLNLILNIINSIKFQLIEKYGKYTLLKMLKGLWEYTFKSHIKMEDHFTTNIEKDIYDGPFKESNYRLASSEIFFLQIWKSQRFGTGIDNFSLCLFDPDNSRKISFLVDVFGTLRLTNYIRPDILNL